MIERAQLRGKKVSAKTYKFVNKLVENLKKNYIHAVTNKWDRSLSMVRLEKTKIKNKALILGAGYSLNKALPLLSKWKGDIFACNGNLKTLLAYGIKPTYLCILDPAEIVATSMPEHDLKDIILLMHPGISNKLIKKWEGEKYIYNLSINPFYVSLSNALFPQYNIHVKYAGSIANTMVQLANFIGYDVLFLAGIDYAFTSNHLRCESWEKKEDTYYKAPINKQAINGNMIWVPDNYKVNKKKKLIKYNGYLTTKEHMIYKHTLIFIYGRDCIQLINCSDGIINEFPQANIKNVINTQGKGMRNLYRRPYQIKDTMIEYFKDDYSKKPTTMVKEGI